MGQSGPGLPSYSWTVLPTSTVTKRSGASGGRDARMPSGTETTRDGGLANVPGGLASGDRDHDHEILSDRPHSRHAVRFDSRHVVRPRDSRHQGPTDNPPRWLPTSQDTYKSLRACCPPDKATEKWRVDAPTTWKRSDCPAAVSVRFRSNGLHATGADGGNGARCAGGQIAWRSGRRRSNSRLTTA